MDMVRCRFFMNDYQTLLSFVEKLIKNEKILKIKVNLNNTYLSNIMITFVIENWNTKENYVCEMIIYLTDKDLIEK